MANGEQMHEGGVQGKVWLVGAGPGDVELLTLKAARLIGEADALVYDNLVGPGAVELAPPDCQLIYAGKKAADHTLPQPEINELLISLARQGKTVVRLKGGDPFIFGRGGEELEALHAAGIEVGIVPGVTAAAGCAAAVGFPLTHREFAQTLVFVTGHRQHGGEIIDWPALARPGQTVVFYMGIARAGEIAAQLMAHGVPADMPAVVIRHGTLPDQQVVRATLADLPERLAISGIRPPALIIIGRTAALTGLRGA
mgnify:CR=1 FL=1